jgi:hypothetical protein
MFSVFTYFIHENVFEERLEICLSHKILKLLVFVAVISCHNDFIQYYGPLTGVGQLVSLTSLNTKADINPLGSPTDAQNQAT